MIPSERGDRWVDLSDPESDFTATAVLFELLPGSAPPEDDLGRWVSSLGTVTARMHEHSSHWTPASFDRPVWDFDAMLGKRQVWGPWDAAAGIGRAERQLLTQVHSRLAARIADHGADPERWGPIHADLRLDNLLVDGESIAVIDFDGCGTGWHLYDLATAFTFVEHVPHIDELVAGRIEGYRAVRPFSTGDEAEIPTFMMLRRLFVLAWLGSHADTELAREQGEAYTAATCDLGARYLARTS